MVHFSDSEINLPYSGNGIPYEVAWLIRFFYRTRQMIMDLGYGSGGIGSRITGDHFGGDQEGNASYDDIDRIWIVSGEDPHTTYKYSALSAHLAYLLRQIGITDPENINWEAESKAAFQWAEH
jgi:hypothetical protein